MDRPPILPGLPTGYHWLFGLARSSALRGTPTRLLCMVPWDFHGTSLRVLVSTENPWDLHESSNKTFMELQGPRIIIPFI